MPGQFPQALETEPVRERKFRTVQEAQAHRHVLSLLLVIMTKSQRGLVRPIHCDGGGEGLEEERGVGPLSGVVKGFSAEGAAGHVIQQSQCSCRLQAE